MMEGLVVDNLLCFRSVSMTSPELNQPARLWPIQLALGMVLVGRILMPRC